MSNENIESNNKESNIKEARDQTITIITASLSLVAGLAWNECFKNLFQNNKHLKNVGPWVYAGVITIIAVVLIIILNKFK